MLSPKRHYKYSLINKGKELKWLEKADPMFYLIPWWSVKPHLQKERNAGSARQHLHNMGELWTTFPIISGGSTKWYEIPFSSLSGPVSPALTAIDLLASLQSVYRNHYFFPPFLAWLAYILMEKTCSWKVTKVGSRRLRRVRTVGSCWATQSKRCNSKTG